MLTGIIKSTHKVYSQSLLTKFTHKVYRQNYLAYIYEIIFTGKPLSRYGDSFLSHLIMQIFKHIVFFACLRLCQHWMSVLDLLFASLFVLNIGCNNRIPVLNIGFVF